MIPGKSDIYSAGVIFYKLVSGDSVFNQSDFFNFQQQIQKKDVDFFYKFKIRKAQQSLIQKMLRVNPNIRYSALKCLTHRYFKSIFNPEDLLSDLKQKIQRIDSQIQKGQISINAHNQEPNQQQESPNSIQSPTNGQVNEGLIQRVTKYSKFHQFCEQMKYSKTHSNSKKSEVSLLKLQNSKNQGSKDDIFLNPIITASKGIKRSSLKL